jgi:hypothetical protein
VSILSCTRPEINLYSALARTAAELETCRPDQVRIRPTLLVLYELS